jgi:hypothetical protein
MAGADALVQHNFLAFGLSGLERPLIEPSAAYAPAGNLWPALPANGVFDQRSPRSDQRGHVLRHHALVLCHLRLNLRFVQLLVVLEINNGPLTQLLTEGLPLCRALPESLSA